MDGLWFLRPITSHYFTLSLFYSNSPIHPSSAKRMSNDNGGPLDELENRLLTGTRDLRGSHGSRAAPAEINGTCNWVLSLGCVGVATARGTAMVVLGGWWLLVCGGWETWRFMSHTKWHWRVRQRAVGCYSCIDVKTMSQKIEKRRRKIAL